MKRLFYAVTITAVFTSLFFSCKKKDDESGKGSQAIKIGALLSETGNWSSLGATSKAAIEIATEEVNAYMARIGSEKRFEFIVYDTKLEPDNASRYIEEAGKAGCRFVLGPQSSAEAAGIREYANTNDILVVSHASTAGTLSVEGDNLFRFCPDDHIEGKAMANTIYKDGIRALITAARDDAGNVGLQTSTGDAFGKLGAAYIATSPYSSTAEPDFTSLLADIKEKINSYTGTHPLSEIAVYLASFDECVELFRQAANDPVLSSVRWYGGDGTALSAWLTDNAEAAAFAVITRYFAPAFGLPTQAEPKWKPLSEEITKRTGIAPDAFALAVYDALWVIALSYDALSQNNPAFDALKTEFTYQAGKYYGATGTTMLNAAGDRATGSYDYWGIVKEGSAYKWTLVGKSE